MTTEKVDNFLDAGATLIFIFLGWGKAVCLAHIFLVKAKQVSSQASAIIALNHNGRLLAKSHDRCIWHRKTQRARKFKTKVLIFCMAVPLSRGRFQNMRRGHASRRYSPFSIFQNQGGLRLGA